MIYGTSCEATTDRQRTQPVSVPQLRPGLRHDRRAARMPALRGPLHRRKSNSLNRTWAYMFAALAFYVPANLLPVMNTVMLGNGADSTIMSGVLEFWEGARGTSP